MMSKKLQRRVAMVCAGLFLLAAVTACASTSSSGGDATSGADASDITVGNLRFGDNSALVLMADEFDQAAKSYGWEVLPAQSAKNDAGAQMGQIQAVSDQGVDGLVIQAVDANGIVPGLEYAASKGVQVVAVDNVPASGPLYIGVTSDQTAMAVSACEAIGEGVGGEGVVLAIQGAQSSAAGLNRANGFNDCMNSEYPDIEVVDLVADWDASQAANLLGTALTQHPDAAGIFLASDTAYLGAILQTLTSKGVNIPAGEAGHIYIATIDGTPESLAAIRDGQIDAAVSQPLPQMGQLGAAYLKDAFDGKEVKAGPTDHNSEIEDINGVMVDLLPAVLVTTENVDDPELWANAAS